MALIVLTMILVLAYTLTWRSFSAKCAATSETVHSVFATLAQKLADWFVVLQADSS
jgi:hypothetical protein